MEVLSLGAIPPPKDKSSVTQPEPWKNQNREQLGGEGKQGVWREITDHPVTPWSRSPTIISARGRLEIDLGLTGPFLGVSGMPWGQVWRLSNSWNYDVGSC